MYQFIAFQPFVQTVVQQPVSNPPSIGELEQRYKRLLEENKQLVKENKKLKTDDKTLTNSRDLHTALIQRVTDLETVNLPFEQSEVNFF